LAIVSVPREAAALTQLERAIALYMERDYIPAITLAGAAESLLGGLLKYKGRDHALDGDVSAAIAFELHLTGEDLSRPRVISDLNYARDQLKHFGDGADIVFDLAVAAYDMIERAIGNYWRLSGTITNTMEHFFRQSCPDV